MEQHPVPQHIASFQFKLFGNLTVRQFITLLGPAIVAALIFFSEFEPVVVKYFIAAVVGAAGFIVAVVPVGGRPFDKWIVAFVKAVFAPTQRIWIKEKQIPEFLSVVTTPVVDEKIPEEVTAKGKERLVAYLKSLPKDNQSPLDTREQLALSHLDFKSEVVGTASTPAPIAWPSEFELKGENGRQKDDVFQIDHTREIPKFKVSAPKIIKRFQESPAPTVVQPKQLVPLKADVIKPVEVPAVAARVQIHPSVKHFSVHGIEERIQAASVPVAPTEPVKPRAELIQVIKKPRLRAHLASDGNFSLDNIISLVEPDNHVRFVRGVGKTRVRKLHFAPPANFDISKLPIRGERRFEISEELKKRFTFDDESPAVVLPSEKSVNATSSAFDTSSAAKQVNQLLPKQAKVAAQTMPTSPFVVNKIEPKVVNKVEAQPQFAVTDTKKQEGAQAATVVPQIIPLTSTPNVISGLVTDQLGTPIVGAVLVVRDTSGIPVRALKTNKLGQFLSATPLANGSYTVEAESEAVNFKPASLNLSGQIVAPLGLKGEAKIN